MKILSFECSAVPCSAAVMENGKILASAFSNIKLTHSQTLMPMAESVLTSAGIKISDINALAVTNGPGSFTGIRIGISAVKGLAQAKKLPCVGISTLEAMAVNYSDTDCIVCSVMDARCNQVYNALFENHNGQCRRLCEDRALSIDDLMKEICDLAVKSQKIYIVGDGALLFADLIAELPNVSVADEHHRYQNAVGVSVLAEKKLKAREFSSADTIEPIYLRLPQAERELKRKEEKL